MARDEESLLVGALAKVIDDSERRTRRDEQRAALNKQIRIRSPHVTEDGEVIGGEQTRDAHGRFSAPSGGGLDQGSRTERTGEPSPPSGSRLMTSRIRSGFAEADS